VPNDSSNGWSRCCGTHSGSVTCRAQRAAWDMPLPTRNWHVSHCRRPVNIGRATEGSTRMAGEKPAMSIAEPDNHGVAATHVSAGLLPDLLSKTHLVGIGGAGMSGIARILLARGGRVSGSDVKESRAFLPLRAQGGQIVVGQTAENLELLAGGPSAVVVSTAIQPDNPELVAAHERGVSVLHRSQALAELMVGYRVAC